MTRVLTLPQIEPQHRFVVGGKCFALAEMARADIPVPDTLCVTTNAYEQYVTATGLRERILLELSRKRFEDMRWEEMWDASLRIRGMFLNKMMPADLSSALGDAIAARFGQQPVVVRSSAPGEDSETFSFAGLHESSVNVRGIDHILEHIRLVWASLWSDAALLYRQELGLDVERATMAVAVQEIALGDRSGVAFSRSPNQRSQAVIEAVHGLNQGLVDGTVEPDRWLVDRATGEVASHASVSRDQFVILAREGVRLEALPQRLSARPPLTECEVSSVFGQSYQLENLFGSPQDVEWTWGRDGLVVLQSRPITTLRDGEQEDERRWYLSLRRSFENLRALRGKIEGKLIPAMIEEADDLAAQPVTGLSDRELAAEIERRVSIHEAWIGVYWAEFIPFAHGIRLFGQVYNDAVHPEDAYEFMDLLAATEMASLERNRALEQMAAVIRGDPHLAQKLRERDLTSIDARFLELVDRFVQRYGDLSCAITGGSGCLEAPDALIRIILEMAEHPPAATRLTRRDVEALRMEYLAQFSGEERLQAEELLDLARASYRLRDDDNIYLGRIEAEVLAAVNAGRGRLTKRGLQSAHSLVADEVAHALRDLAYVPEAASPKTPSGGFEMRARQLIGQPAGQGIARGPARVVAAPSDLADFAHGDILVCDAVDPNMTFVVPLAAGVVERRGGMLIHGAIIAREYGLPCVTGVPDAVSLIATGDWVTVDGYLGIVTLDSQSAVNS
ncbi:MAG: PEP/pyruvate-binding domain-containing protein [Anaerolineae bacterium]|jgi:pyruvate,water dikinase